MGQRHGIAKRHGIIVAFELDRSFDLVPWFVLLECAVP
jgi:hypothetical protein